MEYELPVLVRWVAKSELKSQHPAKYLDIILYSKEQIQKEDEAGGRVDPNFGKWINFKILPMTMELYRSSLRM